MSTYDFFNEATIGKRLRRDLLDLKAKGKLKFAGVIDWWERRLRKSEFREQLAQELITLYEKRDETDEDIFDYVEEVSDIREMENRDDQRKLVSEILKEDKHMPTRLALWAAEEILEQLHLRYFNTIVMFCAAVRDIEDSDEDTLTQLHNVRDKISTLKDKDIPKERLRNFKELMEKLEEGNLVKMTSEESDWAKKCVRRLYDYLIHNY